MHLLRLTIYIFGVSWILFIIMFTILGGRIVIKLKNPLTKEFETILDETITHQKKED